jgi:hypothetical protein
MIGKLMIRDWCGYGCCTSETSKTHIKREEMALALKEAEIESLEHYGAQCPYDPIHGCVECWDFDDDCNVPEDLEGIEGVTFGQR